MGGDAKRAVEILERADVPYLKPFCLTKVTQDEWKNSAGVNPGEFMISILLPELDGGILSMPVGVMGETEDGELPQLIPEKERIHTLGKRLDAGKSAEKEKCGKKRLPLFSIIIHRGRVMFSEEHFWILLHRLPDCCSS